MSVGETWLKANAEKRDQIVQANAGRLFCGNKITKNVITWSTPSIGEVEKSYLKPGDDPKFTQFTDTYIQATKSIFNYLSSFLNLDFQYVTNGESDLDFGFDNADITKVAGYAALPNPNTKTPQDLRVNEKFKDKLTSFSQEVLVHEIGHLLGLNHTFEQNITDIPNVINPPNIPNISQDLDTSYFSVMSYSDFKVGGEDVTTFMPLDVETLKKIYGERSASNNPFLYQFLSLNDRTDQSQYFTFDSNKATLYLDSPSFITSSSSDVEFDFSQYSNTLNKSGVIIDLVERYLMQSMNQSEGSQGVPLGVKYEQFDDYSKKWSTLDTTQGYPYSPYIPTVLLDKNLKVDRILGSPNVDTLRLLGSQKDYKISAVNPVSNLNNTFLVTNKSTKVSDTITGIEKLEFVSKNGDTITSIDKIDLDAFSLVNGKETSSGEIFRLYSAGMGRLPDIDGFHYWINQSNYLNMNDIAQSLMLSQEYANSYGINSQNSDFVKNLYINSLGRSPDSSGIEYWTNVLDMGASRSTVLMGFADSLESKQIFSQLTGFV